MLRRMPAWSYASRDVVWDRRTPRGTRTRSRPSSTSSTLRVGRNRRHSAQRPSVDRVAIVDKKAGIAVKDGDSSPARWPNDGSTESLGAKSSGHAFHTFTSMFKGIAHANKVVPHARDGIIGVAQLPLHDSATGRLSQVGSDDHANVDPRKGRACGDVPCRGRSRSIERCRVLLSVFEPRRWPISGSRRAPELRIDARACTFGSNDALSLTGDLP